MPTLSDVLLYSNANSRGPRATARIFRSRLESRLFICTLLKREQDLFLMNIEVERAEWDSSSSVPFSLMQRENPTRYNFASRGS